MINKKLDIIEEQLKTIKVIIDSDEYFKSLEKSIEYVNQNNNKLRKENNKYKNILDKAYYWLSENTHYTDFNVDKLVLDENVNLKELLELLEEIE